jgi:hypothetical protein
MEAANRVKAIGGNPGILRGSISLPLAGLNASGARQKYLPGRQKSQKPTVVGISTGFLTVLTLLTGPSHPKGVRQNEPVRTLGPMSNPEDRGLTREEGLADLETEDPVFNIKAAARLCDTSHATVRRRLQAGKFPTAKRAANGQDWEIPLADLLGPGRFLVPGPRRPSSA